MKRICMLALLALASQAHAYGEEEPSAWQGVAGIGLTAGGDEFSKVHVSDKSTGKIINNENIRAGRLFQLDLGTRYRFSRLPLSLQATLGYHYDSVQGERLDTGAKVSLSFTRFPLELLPAWHIDKHSLGVGLRYDLQPEYKQSDGAGGTYRFKSQPGLIGEYSYAATDNVSFGLRYVGIKYKLKDDDSVSIKGNHVGINARVYF
ncbi:hypothetical protein ABWL39_11020 [Chitinivorax sp. PXF-14]|uniref:outer membrane beta-barrel protein n=1 Tax=Chitinivorax sp. PXF-14 TaxID=3230488 RepID=UPI003466D138